MLRNRFSLDSLPLLFQSVARQFLAFLVTLTLTLLATIWLYEHAMDHVAEKEIGEVTHYYRGRIDELEQQWQVTAINLKAQIEFTRLLEDRRNRWDKLTSYLTIQNISKDFSQVMVSDRDDQVLFHAGENGFPTVMPHAGFTGWHYHAAGNRLYRVYHQPLWLGPDGMGHLILLRPMDNALLYQNSHPHTRLFLGWQEHIIAASNASLERRPAAGGARSKVTIDGQHHEQFSLAWEASKAGGPLLIIQREIQSAFSIYETLLAALAILLGLLLALWATFGFWMTRTAGRISLLGDFSHRFLSELHLSPALAQLLATARSRRNDEIDEVAESLGKMAEAVAQRDAERHEKEQVLLESEARVREITAVLADGVFVLDHAGRLSFLNPEAERLLGWQEIEVVGQSGHELFHDSQPDGSAVADHDCIVHQALSTGNRQHSDLEWFKRKDGSFLPVALTANPIVRDSQVVGVVAAFHDITHRLAAETALRESEAKFRLLFNSGNDAVFVHPAAPGARFIEVNDVACRRLSYSREELLQMTPADIDDPASTGDMAEVMEKLFTRGYCLFERSHVSHDGKKIPVEINAHLFDLHGQPMVLSVVRDITERKQAEQQYKTVVQTALDGYLICETHTGRLLDSNDAYCDMIGYRREELLAMRVQDVEAQENPIQTQQHLAELSINGRGRFETRHRRKDGQVIDVEVSARFLDIRGGILISFVRDITERKRTEAQVIQLAYYDSLTLLPNRRLMIDRLNQALASAKRHHSPLALMFLDLDGFKQVNDRLGHDVGDELLKVVAGRLNACVRTTDTVSRQGGDEFVVLLQEIEQPDDASVVANKILEAVAQTIEVGEHRLQVTASIGIALYPSAGEDPQTLMKHADSAMYQAKGTGKNRYHLFSGSHAV